MSQLFELLPTLLLSVSSFILAILIIVTVHELGHYLVGRWRGIGADVFSVGFGPELLAVTDRRGTRWRLAALPFGGYVRFRGDASAASAPSGAGGAGTFEAASLRSRTLTVLAGPVANF
ncbi:MAG: site-2 protease family protein, partial [Myxococcales bacterium]|nr:site-2 protease family protein [Myxococcales bacterium]